MVEAFIERLENRFDLREVANPAGMGIQVAAQVDGHLERVPMQTPAFVAFRYVGQAVGGFEGKLFEDFHSVFSSVRCLAGGEFNSLLNLCAYRPSAAGAHAVKGLANGRRACRYLPMPKTHLPVVGSRSWQFANICCGLDHRP